MLQAMEQEHRATRRVLSNVQEGDWKPDPKSRSARELAWHIATSQTWFLRGIAESNFSGGAEPPMPNTTAEMITVLDQGWDTYAPQIATLSGDKLIEIVDFFGMKMPLYALLNFAHVHTVHHRAQLSTYLRPLGGKCPDIYGGSADEPWQPK
jgi:uncharacterized damage-inducible protein DinB